MVMVSPVEERKKNVENLKLQIPDLYVIEADRAKCDLFTIYLNSLDAEGYDGIVMLEDDIMLCEGFMGKITQVIHEHNADVIQFFTRALSKNLSRGYKNGGDFSSTVCNYYPASFCKLLQNPEYIKYFKEVYYPTKHEPWTYPIDTYIAFVLGYNHMKHWLELPFLVQHLALKSTLGNRSTKRQSIYFIDDMKERSKEWSVVNISQEIAHAFLKENHSVDEKAGINIHEEWVGIYDYDRLISVTGISVHPTRGYVHTGSSFTLKEYRNLGCFKKIYDYVMAKYKDKDFICYCRPATSHVLQKYWNFKCVQTLPNGTDKCVLRRTKNGTTEN